MQAIIGWIIYTLKPARGNTDIATYIIMQMFVYHGVTRLCFQHFELVHIMRKPQSIHSYVANTTNS